MSLSKSALFPEQAQDQGLTLQLILTKTPADIPIILCGSLMV